ncbi:MAG: hypothetical protein JXA97_04435 [Anaerolineales bacterium]|nr:hypothetical protein [Anaerolineales bacterium]
MDGIRDSLLGGDAEILERMRSWGYQFAMKSHPDSPGFSTLMIAIREVPTRKHYDAEVIRVQVPSDEGMLVWTAFHFQQRALQPRELGYTRIILKDRLEKAVSFYCFGGKIESIAAVDINVYIIRSQAPIIDLSSDKDILAIELANEADILIARIRASFGGDEQEYARRIHKLSTKQRYGGTIHSIQARLQLETTLRSDSKTLSRFLQREAKYIHTTFQVSETLEALLGIG